MKEAVSAFCERWTESWENVGSEMRIAPSRKSTSTRQSENLFARIKKGLLFNHATFHDQKTEMKREGSFMLRNRNNLRTLRITLDEPVFILYENMHELFEIDYLISIFAP